MNSHSKTGLEIAKIALVIGVLGNLLLRATPWGLNVTLFNIAFVAGLVWLMRRRSDMLTKQTIALLGAQVFFAAMFAWRDASELKVASTFAIIAILSVLFVPRMGIAAKAAGVFQYLIGFVWSGLGAIFSPFVLVFSDIKWASTPATGASRHVFSVLKGAAIVAPILLIFGALFVAADAVYAGWVKNIFNIDFETGITHVILTAVFAWLSAGYLRTAMFTSPSVSPAWPVAASAPTAAEPDLGASESIFEHINISDPPQAEKATPAPAPAEKNAWDWARLDNSLLPSGVRLGAVEIAVILGLIDLLFLSFVIVQIPYLFGGMDLVQNTPDFKLAEYARSGFGELVAVAALVLPILLVSHWLIRKESSRGQTLFRVFAGIQLALLFVIMASAVHRLALLTGSLGYGLTTVRLYPLIFMSWLAVVFVWFGATVLRGYRQYFAWGALWAAFLFLGATYVLNPDEFIVKTNIALTREGREFDATYNASLSRDAVPALISSLPVLSGEQQCIVRRKLWRELSKREEHESIDLRSWNLARSIADPLLAENTAVLESGDCPETRLVPVQPVEVFGTEVAK